jgi:hypothetical protein
VRHPHINRLYAISADGPQRALVLEFMDIGSLDTRLTSTKLPMLQWRERVLILVQVAKGGPVCVVCSVWCVVGSG